MDEVKRLRIAAGITQAALASAGATSQPTIAAYETGRKSPTLATLRRLAQSVGLELAVEFVRPLSREERRSLHLQETIAERLSRDPEPVIAKARANLALMMDQHPGARPLLDEWRSLLELPLTELLAVLRDPRPHARELRNVTPFAGILSARERAATYRAFAEAEGRK